MNEQERDALEAAGFRIGDAEDFLELNDEERRLVELRVAISRAVRARREQQGLTQQQVARRLKTSQPRVAMMEAGAADVSLDSMFRGLFVLGGGLEDLHSPRPVSRARRPAPAKTVVRSQATAAFRRSGEKMSLPAASKPKTGERTARPAPAKPKANGE